MGSRDLRIRDRSSISLVALLTALFFLPGVPAAVGVDPLFIDCATESLQDAIDAALPGQTILPEGTCVETVIIHKDTEIDGRGQAVIDGAGQGPVVTIEVGVSARLVDMFIENGAAEFGAGLLNEGDLELVGVWVRNNGVDTSNVRTHRGAGVFNASGATLEMVATEVIGNVAWWAAGGIYNHGEANLVDSVVSGNVATARHNRDFSDPNAGGIVNTGTLNVRSTWFEANQGRNVGAIDNRFGGVLNVTDETVFINHGEYCGSSAIEGGAVRNKGTAFISNSHFTGNHASETGGVIANFGRLDLAGSSLTDNTVCDGGGLGGGGAIYNFGTADITDSTFDTNWAPDDSGGAVFNEGTMSIRDSSFLANWSERGGAAIASGSSASAGDAHLTIDNVYMVENVGSDVSALSSYGFLDATGLSTNFSIGPRVVFVVGEGTIRDSDITISQSIETSEGVVGIELAEGRLALEHVTIGYGGNPAVLAAVPDPESDSLAGLDIRDSSFVGGGVVVGHGGSLEMGSSSVSESVVNGNGGGLRLDAGTFASVFDVDFQGNSADKGGAIYMAPDSTMFATGLVATGNEATHGGAVFIDGSGGSFTQLEVGHSEFLDNHATVSGGAFALESEGGLDAWEIVVDGNSAGWNGGGIHAKASYAWIYQSKVNTNSARSGGGIAAVQGSRAGVGESIISGNAASEYGAGVFNVASEFSASHSAITNNRSALGAGGIENRRAQQNGRTVLTNTTVAGNEGPVGSAIANRDGFVSIEHVTITKNLGSAAFYEDKSPPWTSFLNSIVAGNPDGDCDSIQFTAGGNVVGDCMFYDPISHEPTLAPTDIDGVDDPILVPTAKPHEGITYFVPAAGSPALNRVPVADCTQSEDQIRTVRPIGVACESGSIESPGDDSITPEVDSNVNYWDRFPSGPLEVAGTASDNIGVTWVGVAIRDRLTDLWLQPDGETWGALRRLPATLSNPGGLFTGWSLPVDLPDGTYELSVLALDEAGNEGRLGGWRIFYVGSNTTSPTVEPGFERGEEFEAPVVLFGTASDDESVVSVRPAIQDRGTGLWLQEDQVSWGGNPHRFRAELSAPGAVATEWTFEVDLPPGSYFLTGYAYDQVGNEGQINPWHRFSVAAEPAPAWKVLVLVYEHTDFEFNDGGVDRHLVAQMTPTELSRAESLATDFFEIDVPALTSGILSPDVTVRFPTRALGDLDPICGRFAGPTAVGADADPAFDSVFTIWDSTGMDDLVGQPLQVAQCGGLAYHRGTGQTFATVPVGFTTTAQRNVFKHEWGHSVLFYHAAAGNTPSPTVSNHIGGSNIYVHCGTGTNYILEDETLANPIPNSIYNNEVGFTHDYYSGTTARPESPNTCLGIGPGAWGAGGPVTKP